MRSAPSVLFLALAASLASISPAPAQIPDEFTNLKVLPEDISKRELTGIMRSFAGALDVRCNHCHVGDNPESLEGYDFASDEKDTKRTARVMLEMVQAINGTYLAKTDIESPIEVGCVTCHRGLAKPESLDRVVLAVAEEEGVAAALDRYRELREEHYGAGAYDFSATTLDQVTEILAMRNKDIAGAMAANDVNLEFHPDAAYTLFLRSRLLTMSGDREGAIAALEKALAANPEEAWIAGQLEELRKPPEPETTEDPGD